MLRGSLGQANRHHLENKNTVHRERVKSEKYKRVELQKLRRRVCERVRGYMRDGGNGCPGFLIVVILSEGLDTGRMSRCRGSPSQWLGVLSAAKSRLAGQGTWHKENSTWQERKPVSSHTVCRLSQHDT